MSFATQATDDSTDSTANNAENGSFAPRPVTSRYISLQAHLGLLKDAIGAVDEFSMSDSDLPAVKWANAIEDALYNEDGCLGEQQAETPYTTSDFRDQFGDSITTPHDDLMDGERTELRGLFKESENHDPSDLEGQFKLPVVNGERLPLLVADMDVFEEAEEQIEAILAEASEGSTPDEGEDEDEVEVKEDDNEMVKAAKRAGVKPDHVDASLEGFPVPSAGTLDDLEETVEVFERQGDTAALRMLLKLEEGNKDRKGGKEMLNNAIEQVEADEEEDDTDERSTPSDGMTDEDKEEIATAVATAVVEALSN